ncbi:MAG TPA: hypothetical protein VK439_05370, partial [Rubrivivax sp.]|nr:hypothetical protein [Rubrivivax sp.]
TLVGGAALGSFMVTSTASSNGSVVTDAPDASSGSFVSFDVRFSPNSVLVLTGDVFASASGASTANASADGGAYLVLYEAAGGSFGSGQIWAQSYLGTPSANKSGTASASLVNTTGGDLTVVAYGQTYAVAQATPVAEPGSYVLLVAGLLAIGTVVRRRG